MVGVFRTYGYMGPKKALFCKDCRCCRDRFSASGFFLPPAG